jgi:hypothetical protein
MQRPVDDHGPSRRFACWILCTGILAVAGCESRQPAARAGAAIDKAGTESGQAIGRAATATGGALERAGGWVRRRTE